MNKTGRYRYDPVLKSLVKVSDRVPNVQVFDCFCPEGGYYSGNLETFVDSRAHKRRLLESRGLKEVNQLTKREV